MCIYCGEIETVKHVYYECIFVQRIWRIFEVFLHTKITWKNIVLGIRGNNLNVIFRNLLYTIVMYALYKNWNKYMENNIVYPIGEEHQIKKVTILPELYKWNSILKNLQHPVAKTKYMWSKMIINVISS